MTEAYDAFRKYSYVSLDGDRQIFLARPGTFSLLNIEAKQSFWSPTWVHFVYSDDSVLSYNIKTCEMSTTVITVENITLEGL